MISDQIQYEYNNENSIAMMKHNIACLKISNDDKLNLNSRFIYLIRKYKRYQKHYSISFNLGRLIVTIGSILVPSLLTSESVLDKSSIYWVVWTISLVISIINGYIHLFKLDKKYYSNMWIVENLACEFWQYRSLCGKYSGTYTRSIPTHENQLVFFCNNIERLQVKNVEENYIKLFDNSTNDTKDKQIVKSVDSVYQNKHYESPEDLEDQANQANQANQIIQSKLPEIKVDIQ